MGIISQPPPTAVPTVRGAIVSGVTLAVTERSTAQASLGDLLYLQAAEQARNHGPARCMGRLLTRQPFPTHAHLDPGASTIPTFLTVQIRICPIHSFVAINNHCIAAEPRFRGIQPTLHVGTDTAASSSRFREYCLVCRIRVSKITKEVILCEYSRRHPQQSYRGGTTRWYCCAYGNKLHAMWNGPSRAPTGR